MSGEFRESYGNSFLWAALGDDYEAGEHPISQALVELYKHLAVVEKGCAWFEAGDSGYDEPVFALFQAIDHIEADVRKLRALARNYEAVVRGALREAKAE